MHREYLHFGESPSLERLSWSACLRRNQRRAEAAAVSARLGVVVGQLLNLVPASDLGVSVRSVAAAQRLAARGCPPKTRQLQAKRTRRACQKVAKKGRVEPALSVVAIISLRRGDFLFDLDCRDIE